MALKKIVITREMELVCAALFYFKAEQLSQFPQIKTAFLSCAETLAARETRQAFVIVDDVTGEPVEWGIV